MTVKAWWSARSPLERYGAVLLALLAAGMAAYNVLLGPRRHARGSIETQRARLASDIEAVRQSLAELDARSAQLDQFGAETELIRKEVTRLESLMLDADAVNSLLAILANFSSGLEMEFHSIKQRLSTESAEHPEVPYGDVTLEVLFRSNYAGLVNYLRRVESISPLVRIQRLEVQEPKKGDGALRETQLTLATPVRHNRRLAKSQALLNDKPAAPVDVQRSLFGTAAVKQAPSMLADLVVTGISISPHGSTAIVNSEVVRIGDKLNDLVVQDIQPKTVILTDGTETYTVVLQ